MNLNDANLQILTLLLSGGHKDLARTFIQSIGTSKVSVANVVEQEETFPNVNVSDMSPPKAVEKEMHAFMCARESQGISYTTPQDLIKHFAGRYSPNYIVSLLSRHNTGNGAYGVKVEKLWDNVACGRYRSRAI
jgi:hypothetical protein